MSDEYDPTFDQKVFIVIEETPLERAVSERLKAFLADPNSIRGVFLASPAEASPPYFATDALELRYIKGKIREIADYIWQGLGERPEVARLLYELAGVQQPGTPDGA